MYQIDNSSAAAVIPASTAAGTPGYFTDGNPATGIAPTILPAEFMNMVMMEILGVLSAAGITPSKSNFTQLTTAIRAINKLPIILADTGIAGAYAAANSPALTALPATGYIQRVNIAHLNPGASTYAPDGLAAKPIYGLGLQPLQGGELPVGIAVLMYLVQAGVNGGNGAWIIIESLGGASQVAPATQSQHAVQLSQAQAFGVSIQSISAAVAANALTLAWNPQALSFRNPTLTTGTPVVATPISALSLVVPSGATLGTVSGQQAQLVLLVAYNGGTPVLCVSNIAGGVDLSETGVISPTTISAGATSSGVIYSSSAVASGSPYRVVGFVQITEATAGTWATAPTLVQGAGGQALASMQSVGFGQVWTTVIRGAGVTYYNTTSRPITAVFAQTISTYFTITIGGVTFPTTTTGGTDSTEHTYIIPPGMSYSYTGSNVTFTVELR